MHLSKEFQIIKKEYVHNCFNKHYREVFWVLCLDFLIKIMITKLNYI